MIGGVGVDILEKSRIMKVISSNNEEFLSRVYTESELCEKERFHKDEIFYYGTRFAGKEAVFKALSISSNSKINLNEIEILNNADGIPYVTLTGEIAEICTEKKIAKIHISLSYDTDYIVAYVVLEKKSE